MVQSCSQLRQIYSSIFTHFSNRKTERREIKIKRSIFIQKTVERESHNNLPIKCLSKFAYHDYFYHLRMKSFTTIVFYAPFHWHNIMQRTVKPTQLFRAFRFHYNNIVILIAKPLISISFKLGIGIRDADIWISNSWGGLTLLG